MKTTRRILTVLALVSGLALAASPAASAGTYQYYGAESQNPSFGSSAFVQFNAAYSSKIISIQSNHVNCPAYNGAHVTWCGTVGNNTSHAQAGVNYTANGASYWMREDVFATSGTPKCDTRGNASNFVTYCHGVGN